MAAGEWLVCDIIHTNSFILFQRWGGRTGVIVALLTAPQLSGMTERFHLISVSSCSRAQWERDEWDQLWMLERSVVAREPHFATLRELPTALGVKGVYYCFICCGRKKWPFPSEVLVILVQMMLSLVVSFRLY